MIDFNNDITGYVYVSNFRICVSVGKETGRICM